MKADAAREYIETLTHLSKQEKAYLVTSVIFALDKVDNTVGLQQAYLKEWRSTRSDENMTFVAPSMLEGPKGKHIVGNCLEVQYPEAEVAYLDPPYTPADYSTYYHIWDSIARWDKPDVALKTNRRVDRVKSSKNRDTGMVSPWYSKKTALKATEKLVDRLPVKYCVFSYSDEGLIALQDMKKLCSKYTSYHIHEQQHARHVMSGIGAGAKTLTEEEKKNIEYVIVIEK
jgi:adenine-specific DNA-methyltransferase